MPRDVQPAASTVVSRPALLAVLVGGGLAASFDIVYATVALALRGRSPLWTLQSVASGLLGKSAFDGGVPAGLLGLGAHFFILFTAAALYGAAGRRASVLLTRPWLCGAAFGIGIYLFMNFVVLPLSAFPLVVHYPPAALAQGFVSHAILVGWPIALAARAFTAPRGRASPG